MGFFVSGLGERKRWLFVTQRMEKFEAQRATEVRQKEKRKRRIFG